MLPAALALLASVAWGIGDFLGGHKSRSLAPLAVMAFAQPVGLSLLGVAVLARGEGPPPGAVLGAAPAAVLGTIGLVAFYRGMAAGAISIVAPIAGVAAAIPVGWGLASGDRPSVVQELGFVAAVGGIVLTSREPGADTRRLAAGAGWALVAMLCFGGYFVPMHAASQDDFLWAAFLFRVVSNSLVGLAVLVARPRLAGRAHLPAIAAIGVCDTGGNVLFAAASSQGLVSVVSVLASLYPVVTVLLARLALGERVARVQEAGIVATLAGVVLITAG